MLLQLVHTCATIMVTNCCIGTSCCMCRSTLLRVMYLPLLSTSGDIYNMQCWSNCTLLHPFKYILRQLRQSSYFAYLNGGAASLAQNILRLATNTHSFFILLRNLLPLFPPMLGGLVYIGAAFRGCLLIKNLHLKVADLLLYYYKGSQVPLCSKPAPKHKYFTSEPAPKHNYFCYKYAPKKAFFPAPKIAPKPKLAGPPLNMPLERILLLVKKVVNYYFRDESSRLKSQLGGNLD